MPELPEVERAVRVLRRAISGKIIAGVRTLHPAYTRRLSAARRRSLVGAEVVAVVRRGKHQMISLADGRTLHAHFRMTGDWLIDRVSDPLPRLARGSIELTDGTRAVLVDARALGTLELYDAGAAPPVLGPEPTDAALTPASFKRVLAGKRTPIKVALLDQRIIAGLGNIYAAEALWHARIDPRTPSRQLTDPQLTKLLRAIRLVLRRATGVRYTESRSGRFDVYDREGRPCRRCKTPISRIVQGQRSTYFCSGCQLS